VPNPAADKVLADLTSGKLCLAIADLEDDADAVPHIGDEDEHNTSDRLLQLVR
jgi:hypothetical protein